ncbi:MAG: RraA family protein, partial [Propionibacteriaceae bacterium]|nr:RraA family protein [Propionibacteriaceae bacterium]
MAQLDPLDVSTCQLSDALAKLGHYALGLAGIWPLEPAKSFVGIARTVQFQHKDEAGPGARIEYLDYVQPGDVIVIDNAGRIDASSFGGQRALKAKQRNAAGVVLNGAYRDVTELQGIDLPIYGVGRTVASSKQGGIPVAV